jgi:hypothetical protein
MSTSVRNSSEGRTGASPRRRARHREAEFDSLERLWDKKKDQLRREFNVYGRPPGNGDVQDRVAGEDVKTGLARAFRATGDPVFADAIAALRSYGLDAAKPGKSLKAAGRAVFGDETRGYLENMKYLIDQEKHSVKRAAQNVSAYYFVNGLSFETVVKDLETKYSRWAKSSFPPQEIHDVGDLGYSVWVRPKSKTRIYFPARRELVPADGALVPFTSYWRHRFHDGSIEISLPEVAVQTLSENRPEISDGELISAG